MLELTTFEKLAASLNLTKTADEYPALTDLQESIYAAFESYLGRRLELDEYEATGYLYDERTFSLAASPVQSVSSVVVNGVDYTADVTLRIDHILFPSRMTGAIAVTYEGGLEDAPDALKRAAFMQTVHEWQRKDNLGANSVTTDGGYVSWPEMGLLKEVKRLLDPFTHPGRLA